MIDYDMSTDRSRPKRKDRSCPTSSDRDNTTSWSLWIVSTAVHLRGQIELELEWGVMMKNMGVEYNLLCYVKVIICISHYYLICLPIGRVWNTFIK
jgi:hypothetical protein